MISPFMFCAAAIPILANANTAKINFFIHIVFISGDANHRLSVTMMQNKLKFHKSL
jgi:hypothetical protein